MFRRPIDSKWPVLSYYGDLTSRSTERVDPETGLWIPCPAEEGECVGIEYSCPVGTIVHAIVSGMIVKAGYENHLNHSYGLGMRVVQHASGTGLNPWTVTYGHLSQIYAWPGSRVKEGDRIGLAGNSGNCQQPSLHCHIKDHRGQYRRPDFFSHEPA